MGSVKKIPTGSPSQIDIESMLGEYYKNYVGATAERYPGQLYADIPGSYSTAFANIDANYGADSYNVNQALMRDVAGTPAWSSNYGEIMSMLNNQVAIPIMETFKQTVEPIVRGGYAGIPGGLYSAARGRGIENAANQYFTENVLPWYQQAYMTNLGYNFQSTENAANRRLGAINNLTAYDEAVMGAGERYRASQQLGLTADYNEFLRTQPSASPWNQILQSYLGIPTNAIAVKQGTTSGFDPLGLAAGAGAGGLMASAGMLGSLGTGGGAALGALMMLSDVRHKEEVAPIDSALDKVSALKAYSFKYKNSNEYNVGIMAQDLENVLPQGVQTICGIKYVKISAVMALLVDAVNELREKVNVCQMV